MSKGLFFILVMIAVIIIYTIAKVSIRLPKSLATTD
jgi:hypothetical protein